MNKEQPQSRDEEWRKLIAEYHLPEDVVREIERFRTTDPQRLGRDRAILPKFVEDPSPDDRKLAYIKSSFQLPGIRERKLPGPDQELLQGLKKRARDLIREIPPEKVAMIVEPKILDFINTD